MIEKITHDKISLTLPTVFGDELTFLEFCGKMRSKLNECIGVVNENTSDIQQNTTDIQQNTTDIQQNTFKISRNEKDIVDLKGVAHSISVQTDENTEDILNRRIESLFAPVILKVENHSTGEDIYASVYIRIGRISALQGLGCLYAKVNISFSGATDAKTLKIVSVQFGKRTCMSLTDASSTFTAKTNTINLPISVAGIKDIPAGASDITVTGINFFGAADGITYTPSAFMLNEIPTGKDILCDSLTFTSPGGGEQDPKLVYTLKVNEGRIDIFAVSAGLPSISERATIYTEFSHIISNTKIHAQFLCNGGLYTDDNISSVPDNGASLGAAMINYLEDGSHDGEIYTARTILTTENSGGSPNSLKKTGNASMPIPYGQASHISLTFDLFR